MNFKFFKQIDELNLTKEQKENTKKYLLQNVVDVNTKSVLTNAYDLLFAKIKTNQIEGSKNDFEQCLKLSLEHLTSLSEFVESQEYINFIDQKMDKFFEDYEKEKGNSYFSELEKSYGNKNSLEDKVNKYLSSIDNKLLN